MNYNELSLKFSIFDPNIQELVESGHTKDVKASNKVMQYINKKDQESIFEWYEDLSDYISITKKTSWVDLKKSYINIMLNETQYVALNDDISHCSSYCSLDVQEKDKISSKSSKKSKKPMFKIKVNDESKEGISVLSSETNKENNNKDINLEKSSDKRESKTNNYNEIKSKKKLPEVTETDEEELNVSENITTDEVFRIKKLDNYNFPNMIKKPTKTDFYQNNEKQDTIESDEFKVKKLPSPRRSNLTFGIKSTIFNNKGGKEAKKEEEEYDEDNMLQAKFSPEKKRDTKKNMTASSTSLPLYKIFNKKKLEKIKSHSKDIELKNPSQLNNNNLTTVTDAFNNKYKANYLNNNDSKNTAIFNNMNTESLSFTKQNSAQTINTSNILCLRKLNTLTKYDFQNFNMIEKKIEEEMEFDVEKKYKQHGITEIHFNEILEEKERIRIKQSSKVFQYFSRHYKNKRKRYYDPQLKMEELDNIRRKHSLHNPEKGDYVKENFLTPQLNKFSSLRNYQASSLSPRRLSDEKKESNLNENNLTPQSNHYFNNDEMESEQYGSNRKESCNSNIIIRKPGNTSIKFNTSSELKKRIDFSSKKQSEDNNDKSKNSLIKESLKESFKRHSKNSENNNEGISQNNYGNTDVNYADDRDDKNIFNDYEENKEDKKLKEVAIKNNYLFIDNDKLNLCNQDSNDKLKYNNKFNIIRDNSNNNVNNEFGNNFPNYNDNEDINIVSKKQSDKTHKTINSINIVSKKPSDYTQNQNITSSLNTFKENSDETKKQGSPSFIPKYSKQHDSPTNINNNFNTFKIVELKNNHYNNLKELSEINENSEHLDLNENTENMEQEGCSISSKKIDSKKQNTIDTELMNFNILNSLSKNQQVLTNPQNSKSNFNTDNLNVSNNVENKVTFDNALSNFKTNLSSSNVNTIQYFPQNITQSLPTYTKIPSSTNIVHNMSSFGVNSNHPYFSSDGLSGTPNSFTKTPSHPLIRRPIYYYSINNEFLNKEKNNDNKPSSNHTTNSLVILPQDQNRTDIFYLKNHDFIIIQVSGVLEKTFAENIYYKGESIGTLEVTIEVKNIPMIRQVQCGVHTERGFDISSHYLIPTIKDSSGHKEINELNKIYSILIKKLSENSGLKTIYSQRQSNKEIKTILTKLKNLVEFSVKENSLFYQYHNSNEIIKAQRVFILIATIMIGFFDSISYDIKNLMFEIIEIILGRLELNLDLMTLDDEHHERYLYIKSLENNTSTIKSDKNKNLNDSKDLLAFNSNLKDKEKITKVTSTFSVNNNNNNNNFSFKNSVKDNKDNQSNKNSSGIYNLTKRKSIKDNNIKEFVEAKVQIASDYIELNLKLLEYTLENICRKVHDEQSKKFNEFIMAYSYFRLSAYQEEFLNVITNGVLSFNTFSQKSIVITSDTLVGHINNRDSFDFDHILDNPFNTLIDWESLFHEKYKKFPEYNYDLKKDKLKQILNINGWKEKIKKRGIAFYSIILKLKSYIKSKIIAIRSIRWKDIPGFSIILDCVYHDLLSKDVKTISTSCINLMKSFINDSIILNKFVQAMILKTNVYDVNSTVKLFDILHVFFQEYNENRQISSFAYKLDHNLLKKCIKIIIESDQFLCIRKVLWFFYNNAHIMNLDSFSKQMKMLFSDYFFKLFFHWSFQVRNIFFYFLLFIINHKLRTNFKNEFRIEGNVDHTNRRKSILLDKLKKNDDLGFMSAVKTDYLKQLKNVILNSFYSQLRIINIIISQIKKLKKLNSNNTSNNSVLTSNNSFLMINTGNLVNLTKNDSKSENEMITIIPNTLKSENKETSNSNENKEENSSILKTKDNKSESKKETSDENGNNLEIEKKKSESLINERNNNLSQTTNVLLQSSHNYYNGIQISKVIEYIVSNNEISAALEGVNYEYILPAIFHYKELDEQFKIWEKEAKNNMDIEYPKIDLPTLKDDVFDYSDDGDY